MLPDPPVGLIYGKTAGSTYEWRYALGLWFWGWEFLYQVNFFGGRRTAGGQVIDFLVETIPIRTPVYVYGNYWHGGTKKDADTFARLTLQAAMGYSINPPLVVEGVHVTDVETAKNTVFQQFGRGPGKGLFERYVSPFG